MQVSFLIAANALLIRETKTNKLYVHLNQDLLAPVGKKHPMFAHACDNMRLLSCNLKDGTWNFWADPSGCPLENYV
jgi:hypothetical protein